MTEILIWHAKHGDQYYDASTPEAREASSRHILKTFVSCGFVYEPDELRFGAEDHELLALSAEELDALPAGLAASARARLKFLKRVQMEYEDELETYHAVVAAAEGKESFDLYSEQAKENEEQWPRRLAYAQARPADFVIGDGIIHRRVTAWSVLQQRSGYEYEDTTLARVKTITD